MKNKRNASFIELILILFFFMLSSLVIVTLFAKSYVLQQENQAKSLANIKMEEIMNQFLHDPTTIQSETIEYDQNLQKDETGTYALVVKVEQENGLYTLDLTFESQAKPLIHYESAVYDWRSL